MGERPLLEVGVDLLDDRVTAVCLLGLDQDQRAVGKHGVVAVEAEQLLAELAVKDPDGKWASGPCLRSAWTCSMIA